MIAHMIWCAAPQGTNVSIFMPGKRRATKFPGYHGLAPEWVSGGLVDDPNGIDGSEKVRWCMEHYRATDSNNDVYEGIALNDKQLADLQVLLKYAIECALNPGDSVDIEFPSGPITFNGALGLAPGWKDGPLDSAGQRGVSACLGARTNAHGTTVRISLRHPDYPELAVSAAERENFKTHEGAFWGNLFGESPAIHACKVEGGGPAGRLCTDGSCGFTPDPIPSCDDVTAGGCQTQDADGNWRECGAENETIVLNTFLMTETKIASGYATSCAIRENGGISCWGSSSYGALGNAQTYPNAYDAVSVLGLPDPSVESKRPVQISSGLYNSCARLRGGEAYCWGLGYAMPTQKIEEMGEDVAQVASGYTHGCALRMDGTLWCWGTNTKGVLGASVPIGATSGPIQIGAEFGNTWIDVRAGLEHTCALRMDGSVWCIGTQGYGELGNGVTGGYSTSLVRAGEAQLGNDVVQLDAGDYGNCALKTDGTAWCWGRNYSGNLGDGTTTVRNVPVQAGPAQLGNQVKHIEMGMSNACAIKTDDALWCWGSWWYPEDSSLVPYQITNLPAAPLSGLATWDDNVDPEHFNQPGTITSVTCGYSVTLVTLDDGSVWNFGTDHYGEDGNKLVSYPRVSHPARVTVLLNDGDGICDTTESKIYEPLDCGVAACGDGVCNGDETCSTCPSDCAGETYYCDFDNDGVGFNALPNGSLDYAFTGYWTSDAPLYYSSSGCHAGNGCAQTTGSLFDIYGASGAVNYTGEIWVKNTARKGTATVQLKLEAYYSGYVTSVALSPETSVGKNFVKLSVDLSTWSAANLVKLTLLNVSGSNILIDDAAIIRVAPQ